MSTPRGPIRVVQQLELGGRVSVIELHGLAGRTCANIVRGLSLRAATAAVHDAETYDGASVIGDPAANSTRPCPRCGATGDAAEVFGFRIVRGRRVRQSWCRPCRSR